MIFFLQNKINEKVNFDQSCESRLAMLT